MTSILNKIFVENDFYLDYYTCPVNARHPKFKPANEKNGKINHTIINFII
jgi:hypothetical protein